MNFIDKVEEVLREEWENNNGELKIEGDWTVGLDRLEACWEREKNYVADFSEWKRLLVQQVQMRLSRTFLSICVILRQIYLMRSE
jgi:hypothetical protein